MSLEILSPTRPRDATVRAQLFFLTSAARRPRVSISYNCGVADVSEIYAPRSIVIRDARGQATSVDAQGFAHVHQSSAVADFHDEDAASSLGRREAAELVAQATGAARVHVFDHTLRRRAPDAARQPSTRAHVDYTAASGPKRVRDLMGSEADALLKRRFAFINVWRPIRHAARDWPLTLCDARSVDPADLVATDLVYPDRSGEIYGVVHNSEQRWWYYPDMGLDEALLIKCYDSSQDVARFAPHTAFENPLTPPDAPPRESIEFRTIAFFD